ncbi:YjfB family protein [Paenibacillus albidus]|uniref:YjfB family protein n=1 Tax=Paenibacillus albidus TaxID=2041023 RepID=UPI001BE5750D|nr:YjfB family protein [Paenibacillus albidus]MBT2293433.1 YjfB family protein [Paenibacillus albidus]
MDIAALSTSLSQISLAQSAGLSVLNIAKNQAETQGQNLAKMLETAIDPNLGKTLDIRV